MLKFRIISSCLMGAAFLAAVQWLPATGLGLLALALALLGQHEFYGIAHQAGVPVFYKTGMVGGALWMAGVFITLHAGEPLAALQAERWLQVLVAMVALMVFVRALSDKNSPNPMASVAATGLGMLYASFFLSFFLRLGFITAPARWAAPLDDTGRTLILYAVVVVKCADIGAYAVGRIWGRRKLFPRLSPKKTWEGLAGGLAVAVVTSMVFSAAGRGGLGSLAFSLPHALVLGLVLGIGSVAGDLFESLLKRSAGAKDSSALIPGNGGILDVFDSLLFTAPVMYLYTQMFLI